MPKLNSIARYAAWVVAALTLVWIVLKFTNSAGELVSLPQYGRANTTVINAGVVRKAIEFKLSAPKNGKDVQALAESALKDSMVVFANVFPEDFAGSEPPAKQDTLLTIGERTATLELWTAEVFQPHPVGYRVPFTYRHGGEVRSATLVTQPITAERLTLLWGFMVVSVLVGLLYYGIGVFTLYRQGGSTQARVLALLTLALCMWVTSILPQISRGISGHVTLGQADPSGLLKWLSILSSFGTAYWLHLAFVFPFPSPLLARHPLRAYILCYAPPLMALPAKLLGADVSDLTVFSLLSGLGGFAMFVQFFAGFVILRRKRKRATNALERRQLKAVFLGAMLGPAVFIVPVMLFVLVLVLMGREQAMPDAVIIGGVLFLLCLAFLPIPISLLYAFRKYRMMEVELRLRRGTRFAVTTGGLLVVFFAALYGLSTLLLHTFSVHSGTAALAAGLVLALSFAPVQQRTQRMVEQKFFPERNRLRAMLGDVLASASAMPDRVALWDSLQTGLKRSLGIASASPVFYDSRTHAFVRTEGETIPVRVDGDLAHKLLESPRPLFVDEMLASGKVPLSDAEARCLKEQNATVLLPMVIHGRLTGFLMLTFAHEQEDMAAEDLNVLASVVSQVALQSENLRLIEENVEKQRLAEQLAMAREVQQRFLPQVLPDTPGLSVAARFRSSLEVAGDYYDVVPLADGRTLIAVGDVAGKGAGAAMIMANVQASLRSMARAGVKLSAIVSGVNDVLCANTSPEQFVTFFAAVYSPAERSFVSINAGHNPPRLLRVDGSVSLLQSGGFCLGVFPGAEYEEETVPVSAGDVLMLFTDGVCEAMNAAEQEFGEDRIADICKPMREQDTAMMVSAIEDAAVDFHGSASFDDDFTLVVVKVTA